jgi:hypothetical protein
MTCCNVILDSWYVSLVSCLNKLLQNKLTDYINSTLQVISHCQLIKQFNQQHSSLARHTRYTAVTE